MSVTATVTNISVTAHVLDAAAAVYVPMPMETMAASSGLSAASTPKTRFGLAAGDGNREHRDAQKKHDRGGQALVHL
jgi:hypothetical protein